MAQSAFQALQSGEDDLPNYQANTSDEGSDSDDEVTNPIAETTLPIVDPTPTTITDFVLSTSLTQPDSKYVNSSFTPNDDNTIYNDKYVIFGLRSHQNLIIQGQFTLEIQRGAIDINGVIYHSSTPPMKFLNPTSSAIPIIHATQVVDSSRLANKETQENAHLFTPTYKSVIKVTSLHTGLEGAGRLAPLFKHLFWNSNNLSSEYLRSLDSFEEAFTGYTFFPILKPTDTVSTLKLKTWESELDQLTTLYQSNQLLKVLVIGSKNSGKSTFLRLLHQRLLHQIPDMPLHILDLDPGQPEYSTPDTISLSTHTSFQFGNHLSLTSPTSRTSHYVGFSSPKDQPSRYDALVDDLIAQYENDGMLKHESLLVNTPGWIKGYGLTLTKRLVERLGPTHLVYLNSGVPDLEDMKIPESTQIMPVVGSFNSGGGRFSSAQLRVFKMLAFFHKVADYRFDFEPLVFTSPVQVSYGDIGIRMLTVWGECGIDPDCAVQCIEVCAVAVCSLKRSVLEKLAKRGKDIPFVDEKSFAAVLPKDVEFKSLALVHSVDTQKKLINLYMPEAEKLEKKTDHEYILVRAKSEIPTWELTNNEVVKKFGKLNLPYVSFEKLSDYDKAWKVRKNVQRRGQQ